MAHFAKLDEDNVVIRVHRVSNEIATTEALGVKFSQQLHNTNTVFKQTSYNTKGGVHLLGGTPFRKNFATIGGKYDEDKDAFIPPKPYPSWTLNETTCRYDPPVAMPNTTTEVDGVQVRDIYKWDESVTNWVKVT